MSEKLPAPFEGATHRLNGVEPVKAVQWKKDGDHPQVVRYPIERREYKGLLEAGPKEKYALRFGDWVIEDADGRLFVLDGQPRELTELIEDPVGSGSYRKKVTAQPSEFDAKCSLISAVLSVMMVALAALLGNLGDTPWVLIGVTHLMYYRALLGQWNGLANSVFDLDTDTMKVSAHTNTYTVNQDTNEFFSDLTNEVTGTNYTAGGATLSTPTVTRSTGTVTFDAVDVVWTQNAAGFSTGRKFVCYRSTGTGTTSKLYSVVTADADVGNVTGDLTIQWNVLGISTWTTT
jgi:hypothetical protein